MWNIKDLLSPPINTYRTKDREIDINHLYNVFQESIQFLDRDKYMNVEQAVLSQIIYRMKQKFRSAKDFKALEKLNKALKNYFKIGLILHLKSFVDLIPFRYEDETYLPTKNLLDFILVRLQGTVMLLKRIVETSKIAAYLLNKRIQTGHFWKIAFITLSLVSRIYVLAKSITKFICLFYNKSLPFSSQLKSSGTVQFLQRNYVFPKDLKVWLDVDWLEIDDDVQIIEAKADMQNILQFFDLIEDDDVEICDEYVLVDDDRSIDGYKEKSKIHNSFIDYFSELRGFTVNEDIGEVIEINDSILLPNEDSVENIDDSIVEIYDSKTKNFRDDTSKSSGCKINEDIGEVIEINDSMSMLNDSIVEINDSKDDYYDNIEILSEMSTVKNMVKRKTSKKRKRKAVINKNNNSIINIHDCFENGISLSDSSDFDNIHKQKIKRKSRNSIKNLSFTDGIVSISDNSQSEDKERQEERTKRNTKMRKIKRGENKINDSVILVNESLSSLEKEKHHVWNEPINISDYSSPRKLKDNTENSVIQLRDPSNLNNSMQKRKVKEKSRSSSKSSFVTDEVISISDTSQSALKETEINRKMKMRKRKLKHPKKKQKRMLLNGATQKIAEVPYFKTIENKQASNKTDNKRFVKAAKRTEKIKWEKLLNKTLDADNDIAPTNKCRNKKRKLDIFDKNINGKRRKNNGNGADANYKNKLSKQKTILRKIK